VFCRGELLQCTTVFAIRLRTPVLKCAVAVQYSVLQCVLAVCCCSELLQCIKVLATRLRTPVLQCVVAVRYSVLQCVVAVSCCSVSRCSQ